jgi:internalin A
MKSLKRLNLLGTLVTDDGMKYLEDLTRMEDLDLYGVRITDAGMAHFRKMSKLRRLNLLGGQVTDAGTETLSQLRSCGNSIFIGAGSPMPASPISSR